MTKSVLVATPTLGLDPDPDKWLATLMRIQNNIRQHGFSQAFLAPYRTTWWPANNEIWNTAIQYDFDYILRLDDDVWACPDDAFSKLLAADKDVIGALYPMRQFPYSMCAMKRTENVSMIEIAQKNLQCMTEISGNGVIPVDLVGFGMTLIKVAPFKALGLPMYEGDQVCPDDTYFAQKCLDHGIQQYVHADVKLAHREITPANRFYMFNATARLLMQGGIVPRETRQFKELAELFGEDGKKDPTILKAIGVKNDNADTDIRQ